jgi:hypothetical protein
MGEEPVGFSHRAPRIRHDARDSSLAKLQGRACLQIHMPLPIWPLPDRRRRSKNSTELLKNLGPYFKPLLRDAGTNRRGNLRRTDRAHLPDGVRDDVRDDSPPPGMRGAHDATICAAEQYRQTVGDTNGNEN